MSFESHLSKINVHDKAALFSEHWSPKIIGELNGQHVKLAKLLGEFGWHSHRDEDELFLVLKGQVLIQLRNNQHGDVHLNEGDMFIVPRGVEHNPRADHGECTVMLFEPISTVNTGEIINEKTHLQLEHI
jgi:mannose-6-phosphate isomerase-like protein (cupin superfamily)